MLLEQKNFIFLYFFLFIIFGLLSPLQSTADDMSFNDISSSYRISRNCFIRGIYYLINQEDIDKAEEQFKRAILSSPIDSFSSNANNSNRQIIAKSYYFLGKIYYDRARNSGEIRQNIGKSKFYLAKADEYGLIYSRISPPLLDEVNRKYPDIPVMPSSISQTRTRVTIETQDKSYRLDSVRIDPNLNVTKDSYVTNKELILQDSSRYKIRTNYKHSYKTIYGGLVIFGIATAFWFIRE